MANSCLFYVQFVLLVLAYWSCSIGLTFYNKHLFKEWDIPMATTTIHFMITFLLCGFCRKARSISTGKKSVVLRWDQFFASVVPIGFASAFDIALSNWSMVYITVSLYTMVKSTSVLFILAFALALGLEKWKNSLIIVIGLIALGLFLFVFKMTDFNLFGFCLCLAASALSGARWTMSQVLTQKSELGLENPIDTLFHLQPVMALAMAPVIFIHGILPFLTTSKLFGADTWHIWMPDASRIMGGAFLAFFLGLSEYLLVSKTSGLTFSLSGIIKELATMLLAQFKDGDKLELINWIGFIICVIGIKAHAYFKYRENRLLRVTEEPDEHRMALLDHDSDSDEVIYAS